MGIRVYSKAYMQCTITSVTRELTLGFELSGHWTGKRLRGTENMKFTLTSISVTSRWF